MTLTHDLILCTKDRPDDVQQCLKAIAKSSELPNSLIIVDSSSDERTCFIVRSLTAPFEKLGCTIRYVQTSPGLPRQRNIGLRLANADIVHFIDDDSIVDTNYFKSIVETFADGGASVVGVGGVQSNLPPARRDPIRRFFLLSAKPGRVTAAACNSVITAGSNYVTPVSWLSGCAMSFWRGAALEELFDERLEGYALGEDLEFSMRISSKGTLLVQPAAKVLHGRSEVNRLNLRRFRRAGVVNRWYFVRKHRARFSRVGYVWSLVGLTIIALGKFVFKSRHDGLKDLLGIWDGLKELAN